MNFVEAVKAAQKGKKIRREEWSDAVYITYDYSDYLNDRYGFIWVPPESSILAEDWEIVE